MTYDTILFDLDGTLLNTLEDLGDSVNYALSACGHPTRTYAEVRSFIGGGVRNLIERALPEGKKTDEEIDRTLAVFRPHYSENWQNKTCPYEGVVDVVAELARRGKKMGVLSNKFDAATKTLCQEDFAQYIPAILGEREGVPRKPDPKGLFDLLDMLDMPLESAVYVGDSEGDITTARNAGMPCIVVTWGFRDEDVLRAAGPDYVVRTPQELLTLDILK